MAFHLVDRRLVDQRALHHADLRPLADLELDRLRSRASRRSGRRSCPAPGCGWRRHSLPRIAVFGGERALHGGVEIGVVEHDEGCVAAKLERELLHRARGLPHQQLADFGRAGEGDHAHQRIRRELAADRFRLARHHIEHASGDPGALAQARRARAPRAAFRRRLHHHRAARGERRRNLAGDHGEREIPRRDRARPRRSAASAPARGRSPSASG